MARKRRPLETEPDFEPEPNGYMQSHAAKILMKMLYGARMARADLLRAISYLASSATKWSKQCDEDLYRLICYMHTTRDYRQVAWAGDDLDDVKPRLYPDADFFRVHSSAKEHLGRLSIRGWCEHPLSVGGILKAADGRLAQYDRG